MNNIYSILFYFLIQIVSGKEYIFYCASNTLAKFDQSDER